MNKIVPVSTKDRKVIALLKAQIQNTQPIAARLKPKCILKQAFHHWKCKLSSTPNRLLPWSKSIPSAGKSPRIHLPNGVQIDLGCGLESKVVFRLLHSLCGVHSEKP